MLSRTPYRANCPFLSLDITHSSQTEMASCDLRKTNIYCASFPNIGIKKFKKAFLLTKWLASRTNLPPSLLPNFLWQTLPCLWICKVHCCHSLSYEKWHMKPFCGLFQSTIQMPYSYLQTSPGSGWGKKNHLKPGTKIHVPIQINSWHIVYSFSPKELQEEVGARMSP